MNTSQPSPENTASPNTGSDTFDTGVTEVACHIRALWAFWVLPFCWQRVSSRPCSLLPCMPRTAICIRTFYWWHLFLPISSTFGATNCPRNMVLLRDGRQFAAPKSLIKNIYSPTELTIASTAYRWEHASSPRNVSKGSCLSANHSMTCSR